MVSMQRYGQLASKQPVSKKTTTSLGTIQKSAPVIGKTQPIRGRPWQGILSDARGEVPDSGATVWKAPDINQVASSRYSADWANWLELKDRIESNERDQSWSSNYVKSPKLPTFMEFLGKDKAGKVLASIDSMREQVESGEHDQAQRERGGRPASSQYSKSPPNFQDLATTKAVKEKLPEEYASWMKWLGDRNPVKNNQLGFIQYNAERLRNLTAGGAKPEEISKLKDAINQQNTMFADVMYAGVEKPNPVRDWRDWGSGESGGTPDIRLDSVATTPVTTNATPVSTRPATKPWQNIFSEVRQEAPARQIQAPRPTAQPVSTPRPVTRPIQAPRPSTQPRWGGF